MSSLIVEVSRVSAITKHPNADRLAIATVKGWKTCIRCNPETGESELKVGDKCVYFPPDSVMPVELSEKLGITKYLAPIKNPDGTWAPCNRVRAARLRGVASYGFVIPVPNNSDWEIGENVAGFYGITKWEPKFPPNDDTVREHPLLHSYTDIEIWQNFPDVFQYGEEVIITEKIHGRTCRMGYLTTPDEGGARNWEFVCGSHDAQWKEFGSDGKKIIFWEFLSPKVKSMLEYISQQVKIVIVFGEIYGSGVQDMTYGLVSGHHGYRLFDISVDGDYLDYDKKAALCEQFGIEIVPVLYRGPYSAKIVEQFTDGPTTMCAPEKAGAFTGREGIVITPAKEHYSRDLNSGRVILKVVSADFLDRKEATDSH